MIVGHLARRLGVARSWAVAAFVAAALGGGAAEAVGVREFSCAVPMRDGQGLWTDVYMPRLPRGRYPALLVRTPNRRESIGKREARWVCHKGFALVVQDLRGSRPGLGDDVLFARDEADGHDAIRWIACQGWSNGAVVTWGPSAMGFAQNMLAPDAPPALRAQHVVMAFSNMYAQVVYEGGAFRKELVESWLSERHRGAEHLAVLRGHPTYDAFWTPLNVEPKAERVDAPAIFWGGWHDAFVEGTINSFVAVHNRGGPRARGHCRLVVGPWAHGDLRDLVDPRNAERYPQAANAERFFDYWAKCRSNGVPCDAPVHYYVLGSCDGAGNFWRTACNWPPASSATPFYLAPGRLLPGPPGEAASFTYRYDPADPVPTCGGRNYELAAGSFDQRPVESRPDVLVFTSDELSSPLEVAGMVSARLFVASDAPDTDFTVKLSDVYPDGRSMLVVDGIRRGQLRNGFEREEPLEPGQVYEVPVDLGSVAYAFNRGHRLRLAVSSSNAPRYEPNPNTGRGRDGAPPRIAVNAVFAGPKRPSQIVLPVVQPAR